MHSLGPKKNSVKMLPFILFSHGKEINFGTNCESYWMELFDNIPSKYSTEVYACPRNFNIL